MRADVDHLRLTVERYPDHWATAVVNRVTGACLYRAQSSSAALWKVCAAGVCQL